MAAPIKYEFWLCDGNSLCIKLLFFCIYIFMFEDLTSLSLLNFWITPNVTTQRLLELVKKKNLILELTHENSIEFLGTKYLSYILITVSPYSITLAYPK